MVWGEVAKNKNWGDFLSYYNNETLESVEVGYNLRKSKVGGSHSYFND